jgi:hypothetical protein
VQTLARERAAAGAALLDEQLPGWAANVDLSTLDMSHPRHGVLGQNGGFVTSINRLGIVYDANEGERGVLDYGFEAPSHDEEGGENRDFMFAALDEAWTDEVRARV